MKVRTTVFVALLWLPVLIACSEAPSPAKIPEPMETSTHAETVGTQPSVGVPTSSVSPSRSTTSAGHLSPSLKMNTGRAAHTATLLPDGSVLIAGGFREEGTSEISIASAELYDPESNTFRPTGTMNEARSGHTATLLPNGLVLIAGGWGLEGRTSTAELYDPLTGQFHPAASLAWPRASMTATLLQNGQVLIAGGDSARDTSQLVAELYDPVNDEFRPSGVLNYGRSAHTATLLNDGTVLLVGGRTGSNRRILSSAERYDPTTGEFKLAGDSSVVRHKHASVLLQDGKVLILGGSNQDDWQGQYSSAEIYDASLGTFTELADMNSERFKLANAALLLDSGNVLIGGGNRQIELFDAQSQRFIAGERIDDDYYYSTATLLQDGRVLIAGGYDANIQPSKKAWVHSHS